MEQPHPDLKHLCTQVFPSEPSDAQLARLTKADGASFLRVVRDIENYRVCRPYPFPLWFVGIFSVVPVVGACWFARNEPLWLSIPEVLLFAGVATAGFFLFVRLRRDLSQRSEFFIVKLSSHRLELPILNLTIEGGDIVAFVVFRGTERCLDESWVVNELSVLVRLPGGEIGRLPMLSTVGSQLGGIADELSSIFERPVRRV